ncbi:hypothetical protein BDW02DRAFT_520375, partial [Decorospora gaudefroyi]
MTMRLHIPSPNVLRRILVPILLLTVYIHPVLSIPHSHSHTHSTRQAFAALQLPSCALTCLLNHILDDGCVDEADFSCHCGPGNLVGASTACIQQGCDQNEEEAALEQVNRGCKVAREEDLGGPEEVSSAFGGLERTIATRRTTTDAVAVSSTSADLAGESSTRTDGVRPTESSQSSASVSTTAAPQSPSVTSSQTMSTTASPSSSQNLLSPTDTVPMPTNMNMNLGLRPSASTLSDGAKAGIASSIILVALALFLGLGWYIRRLKRDLRAAQRAASSMPEEENASSGAVVHRRPSGRWHDSPVSPLSPTEVTDNGYGVLKRKRGHVLSIVVEREDEDAGSMRGGGVREPVPGQREGLSGPLELDGIGTGLFELSGVVTPRGGDVEK